jgi:hypothetical protein
MNDLIMIIIIFILLYNISLYNKPLYNIPLSSNVENFFNNNSLLEIKNRKFPFRYLEDENHNIIPIVLISAFFRNNEDKALYNTYIKENIPVIGITAYKTFPLKIRDISEDKYHLNDNFNYIENISIWLTCMDHLNRFGIDINKHAILDISESDFYDAESEELLSSITKKYDFIYICNKDADDCPMHGWNSINRNYSLALKCFPIMINEYKLKGLCVGRIGCDLSIYGDSIELTDFLEYHILQQKMRESKFLFLPNIYDASPRVVSECIIKNVPVLMNQNIICGSKYINNYTGEFFIDEHNLRNALDNITYKISAGLYSPIKWWTEAYGVERSSKKLRNFLYKIYPDILKDIKLVRIIV